MEEKRIIKGQRFGGCAPVLCVPVVEKTREGILSCVDTLSRSGVKMIEWRMDWYEKGTDPVSVTELLQELAPAVKQTVLLATFRSKGQGGEQEISEETYEALNLAAAGSGAADLVDLEFFSCKDPAAAIACLQAVGVGVVASDHDFEKTPSEEEITRRLGRMHQAGADFSKLAVMPQKKADVLSLMAGVLQAKEQYPDSHLIAMSMGKAGMVSRLMGQWFGSEVIFAAGEKASAPGQLPYEAAGEVLSKMGEWIQ